MLHCLSILGSSVTLRIYVRSFPVLDLNMVLRTRSSISYLFPRQKLRDGEKYLDLGHTRQLFTRQLGTIPRSQMIVRVCLAPWFIDPSGQSSQGPQQSWAQSLGRDLWTWSSLATFIGIHPSQDRIYIYTTIPWAQTSPQAASSLSGKLQCSDKSYRNNVGVIINLLGTHALTFIIVPLHEAE